jgi:hypothetical protein
MSVSNLSPFLRRVLLADALISGASGLLMALGAGLLAGLLNLPEGLLREAGLVLLPYAAFVAYVATRAQLMRLAVWAIIIINTLWALDSAALLLSGWVAPNALGYAFVVLQAVVVAVVAELQYTGMRRSAMLVAR